MNKNIYLLRIIIILGLCLFYSPCFAEERLVAVEKQNGIDEAVKKCFLEVGSLLSQEDVEEFKSASSDEVANYHFTIGRLMRNNCGLLEDTKLRGYFIENNVERPDDMSMVILESYHLHLNDQEYKIDDLMQRFKGDGAD
jgi:hypothetical protein